MGGKKGKKKKIVDDIAKAPSKRNSLIVVGWAAGLLCSFGYFAGVHHPKPEVEKSAPVIEIVQPVESLEDVLKKTMVIEQVKPGSSGNLFLVGMVHYHKVTDKGNQLYVNISPKLADVQSEIYQLLMDLHEKKNLKLIVGEGLGRGNEDRELRFDYPKLGLTERDRAIKRRDMKNEVYRENIFKEKIKETGYWIFEKFYADKVKTLGVNDDSLMQEISDLDSERFYLLKDKNLTKSEEDRFQKIKQKRKELNDKRSKLYLSECIKLANKFGQENVSLIVGYIHLELMAKEYKGKRTLYVLTPKSWK